MLFASACAFNFAVITCSTHLAAWRYCDPGINMLEALNVRWIAPWNLKVFK